MTHASTASEPTFPLALASKLGAFALDSISQNHRSNHVYCPFPSSFLHVRGVAVRGNQNRYIVVNSLRLTLGGGSSSSYYRRILNDFNRFIQFHCDRIPVGFGSIGASWGNGDDGLRENADVGFSGNGDASLEEGLLRKDAVSSGPKRVLILMRDTGGGHRASAEAIKAAFYEEFGDDYQGGC